MVLLTPMTLVVGCGTGGTLEAFCEALGPRVDTHAAALASEGSDAAVITGADLIAGFDGGCAL